MEETLTKLRWKPSLTLFGCLFTLELLFALDGLRTAEMAASGHGFHLQFDVAFPWILTAGWGVAFWVQGQRGRLDRDAAGLVLFAIGFIVSALYRVIDKLLAIHH